jgi:multidrug efflux pump subunit AcrA (membrane-fusion protein)
MHKTPCLLLGGLLAVSASAADKKPEAPATHKVKAAPFKVEVKLDGLFSAKDAHEIRLRPNSWGEFTVLKAVPHGARVKKGDVLVQLDPEKIDQQIHEKLLDLEVSRLDLELAKVNLEVARETAPLNLANVERGYQIVKEDLERYLKVEKPHDIKSAEFTAVRSANYLAYAEEELKQLKKMYAADDITEETEEIILRRAQDSVNSARHSLSGARIRSETELNVTIPRTERSRKEDELRKRLALGKARTSTKTDLKQKTLALDKQSVQHQLAEEALAKLKADRALMSIKTPAGGVVYYGSFNRGVWSGLKLVEPKLRVRGKLTPNAVFMTIVDPGTLLIRASLNEKDLRRVRAGTTGEAIPEADPDDKLAVTVASVSPVPIAPGKFGVVFRAAKSGEMQLVPGMSCKLTLAVYENKKALAVPAKAVFDDGAEKVVYLKGGKKKVVTTGQTDGGKIEVLKGLKAGDEILLEKPGK